MTQLQKQEHTRLHAGQSSNLFDFPQIRKTTRRGRSLNHGLAQRGLRRLLTAGHGSSRRGMRGRHGPPVPPSADGAGGSVPLPGPASVPVGRGRGAGERDSGPCLARRYRFAEICYRRESSSSSCATLERVVLFFPDVWRCMPTRQEWADLELRLRSISLCGAEDPAGDAPAQALDTLPTTPPLARRCCQLPTHPVPFASPRASGQARERPSGLPASQRCLHC